MSRIVLIEDDPAIRRSLARDLRANGHVVTATESGAEGLSTALADSPDVVILDLGLPDLDGRDVLAMLRAVRDVPVIVATARDDDASMVKLLDAGADDYVVKPFRATQIEARIRAVLRRSAPGQARADDAIEVGRLRIDPSSREVRLGEDRIDLSRKEFDLIFALARRSGEVVSKNELLADVWQQPWGGGDRTVDVHLSWLRRKLGETAAEPRYLHSVRGVGVKLAAPEGD
ncbi:MAG: response regulator transcription factor [Nocardioidaceae bacterium]